MEKSLDEVLDMLQEEQGEDNFEMDFLNDNIIILDKGNLELSEYNEEEFSKGVASMSELCGKITALINCGITPEMALGYITEVEMGTKTMEHNLEISKINAKSNVESAKFSDINMQKSII